MLLHAQRTALRSSGALYRVRCLSAASGPSPEYLRDVVANARQPDAELTSSAIQDLLAAGHAAQLVDLAKEAAQGERERGDSAADGGRLSLVLLEAAAEAGDAEGQFLLGSHFAVQLSSNEQEETPTARVDGAEGSAVGVDEELPLEEAAARRKKVLGEIRRTLRRNRRAQRSSGPDPRAAAIWAAKETRQTSKQEAERWLTAAANQGHTAAMVRLGNLLAQHEGDDDTTLAVARRWFERAAHADPPHPDGLYNLATMLFEVGDASALFWVGHVLHAGDGEAGVLPDREASLRHLRLAADAGHGEAAFYLAQMYRSGAEFGDPGGASPQRVEPDHGEFLRWLARAEALGSADAHFARADMLFHGEPPVERDLRRSADAYAQAGALGHAGALVSLGAMHYHGMGVPQDHEAAFRCYERAGELGSREAWVNVAALYHEGKGVPRCEQTARHILDLVKAGKLGEAVDEGEA